MANATKSIILIFNQMVLIINDWRTNTIPKKKKPKQYEYNQLWVVLISQIIKNCGAARGKKWWVEKTYDKR